MICQYHYLTCEMVHIVFLRTPVVGVKSQVWSLPHCFIEISLNRFDCPVEMGKGVAAANAVLADRFSKA